MWLKLCRIVTLPCPGIHTSKHLPHMHWSFLGDHYAQNHIPSAIIHNELPKASLFQKRNTSVCVSSCPISLAIHVLSFQILAKNWPSRISPRWISTPEPSPATSMSGPGAEQRKLGWGLFNEYPSEEIMRLEMDQ